MKPRLTCSDVITPAKPGFYPQECCSSCHNEMEDGYTNNFDDCDEDPRVDQEFCCTIERIWVSVLTNEERKAIVDKKLAAHERSSD
jgi:hypothetical protein